MDVQVMSFFLIVLHELMFSQDGYIASEREDQEPPEPETMQVHSAFTLTVFCLVCDKWSAPTLLFEITCLVSTCSNFQFSQFPTDGRCAVFNMRRTRSWCR